MDPFLYDTLIVDDDNDWALLAIIPPNTTKIEAPIQKSIPTTTLTPHKPIVSKLDNTQNQPVQQVSYDQQPPTCTSRHKRASVLVGY